MKTHRQIDQNACVQTRRKPKLTKWHAFQKEYGKSDGNFSDHDNTRIR